MSAVRIVLALLAAWLAATAATAVPVRPGPRDWSLVTTRNADGSLTVGNPAARIRMVEYLSLTCPHCAQVAREADEPLRRQYIAPGRLSFTIQHAVRDRYDLIGSMLARCAAPAGYFGAVQTLLVHQDEWIYLATQSKEPEGAPAALADEAQAAGMPALLGLQTFTPARVAACLGNAREQNLLAEMSNRIWSRPGFPGTPVFVINGREEKSIRSWAELEAKIKAAQ